MNHVLTALVSFFGPIAAAMGLYWAFKHMPDSWKGWLDKKKTLLTGISGTILFGLMQIGTELQNLNLDTVLPHESAIRVGFYMSLLMIVLRLVTTAPVWSHKGDNEGGAAENEGNK